MLTTKQRDELIEIKGMVYGLSYTAESSFSEAMLDIAERIDLILSEEEEEEEKLTMNTETLEVKGV